MLELESRIYFLCHITSENTGALSEDRSKIDRNSDTDEESLLNVKVTRFLMTTIGRLKGLILIWRSLSP